LRIRDIKKFNKARLEKWKKKIRCRKTRSMEENSRLYIWFRGTWV